MVCASRINNTLRSLRFARLQARLHDPSSGTRLISFSRFVSTLVILEHREGKLDLGSTKAISAGIEFGGTITGLLAGKNIENIGREAAQVLGLDKVLTIKTQSGHDQPLPEHFASLISELVQRSKYTHVVARHSSLGKNVIPRAAALLGCQPVSDITSIEGEDVFIRPVYAGNAIATVQSTDPVKIITVRSTSFPNTQMEGSQAEIENVIDKEHESLSELVSEELVKSDRPDLGTASRVVSGGRGLKSKAEFDRVLNPLADVLGAAIGASRAAVDSGLADNSIQIGQTGMNVAPQLYLSVGISGAIQRLAGMKGSKVIAAINNGPDAPMFQVADVGLVGDLFEKVPELVRQLKAPEWSLGLLNSDE